MATHDISLMGAVFPGVPKVILPVDGGGTATFTDVSDTTAAAADVASGKYFYTSDGTKTAGTASGGGGSGLVYETGTYTPVSDITQPTISFTNSHTTRPFSVIIIDNGQELVSTNTVNYWAFVGWYDAFGLYVCGTNATNYRYANSCFGYKTSGYGTNQTALTSLGDSTSSGIEYYVTASNFKPYAANTSRVFRSGRTYKWIAVWAPTT